MMDVEKARVILKEDPSPKKKEDLYSLKLHYLFHGLGMCEKKKRDLINCRTYLHFDILGKFVI